VKYLYILIMPVLIPAFLAAGCAFTVIKEEGSIQGLSEETKVKGLERLKSIMAYLSLPTGILAA